VASLIGDDVTVFARNTTTGALTQPTSNWCIKDVNAPTTTLCPQTGIGLDGALALRISPDGNNVYVTSIDSSTVTVLSRNQTTGALSQPAGGAGCVRDVNVPSYKAACSQTANGIRAARDVSISPDGKNVYVAGQASSAVSWFSRNATTGVLTPMSCIQDNNAESLTHCPVVGSGISGPRSVEASPDGKNVYLAALVGNSVAAFSRNATTGALTQLPGNAACIRNWRNYTPNSLCSVTGHGLGGAFSVALSRDGSSLYASSINGNAISEFHRDATTGALTQLAGANACSDEAGRDGCPTADLGLGGAGEAVVSPLGDNVYVDAFYGNAISSFKRDTVSGALTQLSDSDSCVENLTAPSTTQCPVVSNGLYGPRVPAVSPDGRQVYVASSVGNTLAVFSRSP
jgi:6-phosphogluconolactonase (cycloisomerase 2 family)